MPKYTEYCTYVGFVKLNTAIAAKKSKATTLLA